MSQSKLLMEYVFTIIYIVIALFLLLMELPIWVWVSGAITAIHTFEEVDGEIWKSLGVPAWTYFAFQAFVLALGTWSIITGQGLYAFIGIRLVDAIVTHWLLRQPGIWTSPLLALDAIVLIVGLCEI